MRFQASFLLTIFLLLLGSVLKAQTEVPIECFPNSFELFLGGTRQRPLSVTPYAKVYRLPPGGQRVTLSAGNHRPKTVYLEVRPGMGAYRDKLEALGSPVRLVAEIATGYQPKSVRFTPDGKYMAVALLAGRGMQIFNAQTFEKVADCIPPQDGEERGFVETWMLPGRDEIWVSQMTTAKIHVFRLSDWSYVESLPTGGVWSKVIHADKEERYAYVSNWSSFNVSVIDVATRRLVRLLPVPGIPRGIALSPDESLVYVTNFSNSSLSRFRVSDGTVLPPLDVGQGGAMRHAVVLGEDLHLSDMGLGLVHVLDAREGTLRATARLAWNINTIDVSPDGRYLFASGRGTNNEESYLLTGPDYGKVYILERATLRLVGSVWGRNQPTGLAVSPSGRYLAFTDFLSSNLELYTIEPGVMR